MAGDSRFNIASQLFLEVRFAILKGVYLPGEIIDRTVLGELYGCLYPTVLDVFNALVAEGYLDIPKRGIYAVRRWETSEIEDMYDLLASLLSIASDRASRRGTEYDIQKFVIAASKAFDVDPRSQLWIEALTLESIRFQSDLIHMSAIENLTDIAPMIVPNYLHRRIIWSLGSDDWDEITRAHISIAALLQEGSSLLLQQTVREYVYSSRDRVLLAIAILNNGSSNEFAQLTRQTDPFFIDGVEFGHGTRDPCLGGNVIPFGLRSAARY
jgi:DNA-binding GntR family transcriptional regulator